MKTARAFVKRHASELWFVLLVPTIAFISWADYVSTLIQTSSKFEARTEALLAFFSGCTGHLLVMLWLTRIQAREACGNQAVLRERLKQLEEFTFKMLLRKDAPSSNWDKAS